jgi:hypothetical protein
LLQDANNDQVYAEVGKPLVEAVLEGGVGTLFMYGQTGSGKTFTMNAIEERAVMELFGGVERENSIIGGSSSEQEKKAWQKQKDAEKAKKKAKKKERRKGGASKLQEAKEARKRKLWDKAAAIDPTTRFSLDDSDSDADETDGGDGGGAAAVSGAGVPEEEGSADSGSATPGKPPPPPPPRRTPLPEPWEEVADNETGERYYWNTTTGETSWDRPGGGEGGNNRGSKAGDGEGTNRDGQQEQEEEDEDDEDDDYEDDEDDFEDDEDEDDEDEDEEEQGLGSRLIEVRLAFFEIAGKYCVDLICENGGAAESRRVKLMDDGRGRVRIQGSAMVSARSERREGCVRRECVGMLA